MIKADSLARISRAVVAGATTPVNCNRRARVSMLTQVAEQDLTLDRQTFGQDDAGGEWPHPAGDRADERKAGVECKSRRGNDHRRAATSLFPAQRRIEVGPCDVSRIRNIDVAAHPSTFSRPRSGPQS